MGERIYKLYVAGRTRRAEVELERVRRQLAEKIGRNPIVRLVDVLEYPEAATKDGIQYTPCLVAFEIRKRQVYKLYVVGSGPKAAKETARVKERLREELGHDPHLRVINILQSPEAAIADGVVATPALVKVEQEVEQEVRTGHFGAP